MGSHTSNRCKFDKRNKEKTSTKKPELGGRRSMTYSQLSLSLPMRWHLFISSISSSIKQVRWIRVSEHFFYFLMSSSKTGYMFKTLTVKLVDFWLRLSCAQDRSLNLPKTLHLICAKTCCSVTKSYLTLCDTMNYSTPGSPGLHNLQSFLKFMFIESVMLSNHLLLCCPLLLLHQSFPASGSFPICRLFTSRAKILELQF